MARDAGSIEMVWRCPKCGRVFHEHVFEACTSMSGPICNACAVSLVWVAVAAGGAVIGKDRWLGREPKEEDAEESFEDD